MEEGGAVAYLALSPGKIGLYPQTLHNRRLTAEKGGKRNAQRFRFLLLLTYTQSNR
jgi:hypothetical protein